REGVTASGAARGVEADQMHGADAVEGGGEARWIGQVPLDHLRPRGQNRGARIPAEGSDALPALRQRVDECPADGPGRSGDEDGQGCSLCSWRSCEVGSTVGSRADSFCPQFFGATVLRLLEAEASG